MSQRNPLRGPGQSRRRAPAFWQTVIRRLALVILLLILGVRPTSADTATAPKPPNVIVVMTDDQGYGDFSCHGNPVLKTPNLDRLHAEAVRLTDFHVAPMCTPTRGQLLTGRDCLDNGAMNVSSGRTMLRTGITTMGDHFSHAGYRTGQFGKWHVGDSPIYRPQDRGFSRSLWFPSSHIGSAADFWLNDYFDDIYEQNGVRRSFQGYCTDVFFTHAMRFMREQADAGQPFFAYIATNAPHGPLFVPQQYRDRYKDQPRGLASFFGMIANIDDNMGRLDAFLEEKGLKDNTILVFLTDNGGTVGVNLYNAGMRGRKTELYEGGHRVPCFIRWPAGGLNAPADLPGLTESQDILPTLLDLVEYKTKPNVAFDGISLAPHLRDVSKPVPDRKLVIQFSRMDHPEPTKGDAAILWKRWRLLQDKELYDLESDPAQTTNVIDQHPEVVRAMREHYNNWWAEVEPLINEFSIIQINGDPTQVTLLSPCDWQDVFLDQGAQVRKGLPLCGAWDIQIVTPGDYVFELRRWPVESGLELAAPSPEYQAADGVFPAGVALPVAAVRLKVGDFDQVLTAAPVQPGVAFRLTLPSGTTRVQSWLLDSDKKELAGAYYVYVRRVVP